LTNQAQGIFQRGAGRRLSQDDGHNLIGGGHAAAARRRAAGGGFICRGAGVRHRRGCAPQQGRVVGCRRPGTPADACQGQLGNQLQQLAAEVLLGHITSAETNLKQVLGASTCTAPAGTSVHITKSSHDIVIDLCLTSLHASIPISTIPHRSLQYLSACTTCFKVGAASERRRHHQLRLVLELGAVAWVPPIAPDDRMITITMHNPIAKPDVRPSLVQLCFGMPSARYGTSRQRRHAMPTCYAAAEQCILAPLEASRQLAALRAAEVHRAEPRFLDPLAEALMVWFATETCLSTLASH
jgi:hypothetical protein